MLSTQFGENPVVMLHSPYFDTYSVHMLDVAVDWLSVSYARCPGEQAIKFWRQSAHPCQVTQANPPTFAQHTRDFAGRRVFVLKRTECALTDHCVECPGCERQMLGIRLLVKETLSPRPEPSARLLASSTASAL